jgi:hypothetical protein
MTGTRAVLPLGLLAAALFLLLIASVPAVRAEDGSEARQAAALRLAGFYDIKGTAAEAIGQMAESLPEEKRGSFARAAAEAIDKERLETHFRTLLADVFTIEEMETLADFLESSSGRGIAGKMPRLTALIIPLVQAELIHAMERLQAARESKERGSP